MFSNNERKVFNEHSTYYFIPMPILIDIVRAKSALNLKIIRK